MRTLGPFCEACTVVIHGCRGGNEFIGELMRCRLYQQMESHKKEPGNEALRTPWLFII